MAGQPSVQNMKGSTGGSAPIEYQGQTVSAYGSNPSINSTAPQPMTKVK